MPSPKNRWVVLALMYSARLTLPLHFQSVAAVAPFLIAELGFSYSQIGLLMGVYMLPGIFFAIPGGMLGARFGDKRVILGALLLTILGTVGSAFSSSMAALMALRLLGGVGGVVLNLLTNKVVTDHFVGRELATAMAISASAFGLGIGIATGSLGALSELTSWRSAFLMAAAVTALMLGLLLAFYKEEKEATGVTAPTKNTGVIKNTAPTKSTGVIKNTGAAATSEGAPPTAAGFPGFNGMRRLWTLSRLEAMLMVVAGLAQAGFVTGYILFMTFAPVLLLERGFTVTQAGGLVSIAALLSIVSVPLGGMLSDNLGRRKDLLVAGCAVGTALSCLLFAQTGPALLWVILFGTIRGGCTGGVLSLPGEVLRPQNRGIGMGLFFTMLYLGLTILPPVAGWLRDAAGSSMAVMFAGGVWFSIVGSMGLFRLIQHRAGALPPTLLTGK